MVKSLASDDAADWTPKFEVGDQVIVCNPHKHPDTHLPDIAELYSMNAIGTISRVDEINAGLPYEVKFKGKKFSDPFWWFPEECLRKPGFEPPKPTSEKKWRYGDAW